MELAAIHPNALKHGLTEGDIRHARSNAFEWIRRDRDDGMIDYVFIGPDTKGRLSELIARFSAPVGGYIVFHAFTPPTKKILKELGIR